MQDLETVAPQGFIFSRSGDFVAFSLPVIAAALVVGGRALWSWTSGAAADVPEWAYFLCVVLCDAGHVASTFFLAHAASGRGSPVSPLLAASGAAAAACVVSLAAFAAGSALWLCMGYLSVAHYALQQWQFAETCHPAAKESRYPDNVALAGSP
ncbi:hypothetical protein DIPPA_04014 [Diplonema papillatum]|nr:hypothetical protein DIPPA_04014 [Diplonema papillatum]